MRGDGKHAGPSVGFEPAAVHEAVVKFFERGNRTYGKASEVFDCLRGEVKGGLAGQPLIDATVGEPGGRTHDVAAERLDVAGALEAEVEAGGNHRLDGPEIDMKAFGTLGHGGGRRQFWVQFLPPTKGGGMIKIQNEEVLVPADDADIAVTFGEPALEDGGGGRVLGKLKRDAAEAEFLELVPPGLQVQRVVTEGGKVQVPAVPGERDADETVGQIFQGVIKHGIHFCRANRLIHYLPNVELSSANMAGAREGRILSLPPHHAWTCQPHHTNANPGNPLPAI